MRRVLLCVMAISIVGAGIGGAKTRTPWKPGVQLWKGLVSGMSPADARAVIPDLQPSATPKQSAEDEDAMEGTGEIQSKPVEVTTYFDTGHLTDVLISFKDVPVNATESNVLRMKALRDDLSVKYGQPYTCTDEPGSVGNRYSCDWAKDGLRVNLLYSDVGGDVPILNVSYHSNGDQLGKDL